MLAGGLLLAAWLSAPALIARRIRAAAAGHNLTAEWSSLLVGFPAAIEIQDLRLITPSGDTLLAAREVRGAADLMSLLAFQPRPTSIRVRELRVDLGASRSPAADTLEAALQQLHERSSPDRLPILRRNAERFVAGITRPPSQLPSIDLEGVTIVAEGDEAGDPIRLEVDHAVLDHHARGTTIRVRGALALDSRTPFRGQLDEAPDGAVRGSLRLDLPASNGNAGGPIELQMDGRIERRGRGLRLLPGSRVRVGSNVLHLSGTLDARGPAIQLALTGDGLRPDSLRRSVPAAALGPLRDVGVRGSFDYRLSFGLDLARPESVDYRADVVSHGLALDPATTRLNLQRLNEPFMATIHLPRGQVALRDLWTSNPHYLPLVGIDSTLAYAVVTNEDGGFFHHRGFNADAVKDAIAENLRAGAFRRGAGTITMQLVRNLYLGHERTIARKAQEVVLAWVVEHLANVSKQRLLEIYLNIIEWGPGIHGADEAASFYFGHGAGAVSVPEALFLATVIPAPSKWRWRFDSSARLRSYARAQMHFIGRAMVAKGWLDPDRLPPAEEMDVELRGPARDAFPRRALPPDVAEPDTLGPLTNAVSSRVAPASACSSWWGPASGSTDDTPNARSRHRASATRAPG
jgi:transglycosylase-like protein